MNPFQVNQMRRMVKTALRDLGAADCNVKRVPADANGVPTGEAQVIGSLYGVAYRKGYTNGGVRIDLPGIVATDTTRRFACVASDTVTPKEGDTITIDGRDVQVIDAGIQPGSIFFDLTLKD